MFVTCSTPAKRAFLLEAFPELREDHIGDSRSCSFEPLVRRMTNGAGVHLALNSLADDKLQVIEDPITCHHISAPCLHEGACPEDRCILAAP